MYIYIRPRQVPVFGGSGDVSKFQLMVPWYSIVLTWIFAPVVMTVYLLEGSCVVLRGIGGFCRIWLLLSYTCTLNPVRLGSDLGWVEWAGSDVLLVWLFLLCSYNY